MNLEEFREEAIPLMAEDIRMERRRLGMTSARAAKQIGLSASRYWAVEKGRGPRTEHAVNSMLSAAQRLGLESVRLTHVPEVDKFISVALSHGKQYTCFINSLDGRLSELLKQLYFVNPASVIGLVSRLGLQRMFESRKSLDKQLIELWIAATLTIALPEDQDYYVRPVKNDPPDAEVLVINRETRRLCTIGIEITQFGAYSKSILEVLAKKLLKKYRAGTMLVIFVEQSTTLDAYELYEYIRRKNVHNQRIVIVGGAGGTDKIKIMPWELVSKSTPDETAWAEIRVDLNDASTGHLDYAGVIYDPPYVGRYPRAFPVFVREITLRR